MEEIPVVFLNKLPFDLEGKLVISFGAGCDLIEQIAAFVFKSLWK